MSSSTLLSRCFYLSANRNLHDAQETGQKYEQMMWIQHVCYSRSNNDDLQRLERRVDNTLSLFQVRRPLTVS